MSDEKQAQIKFRKVFNWLVNEEIPFDFTSNGSQFTIKYYGPEDQLHKYECEGFKGLWRAFK